MGATVYVASPVMVPSRGVPFNGLGSEPEQRAQGKPMSWRMITVFEEEQGSQKQGDGGGPA